MHLKRIAPEAAWDVKVRWTKPASYEQVVANGSRHDEDGWLYMILGYYGSSHPKLFYVGKVTQTFVSYRLRQPDHRRRLRRLEREHPRHTFRVSLGAIILKGHITKRRVDHLESMLIYSAWESQPHMINEKKVFSHKIASTYIVRNQGYRRPLPREIHLGMFLR